MESYSDRKLYSEDKLGHNAVFGIFKDRVLLERAVSTFKANDFRNSDVSVLMPSKSETLDFAHEKHTKAPEGAATGVTAGLLTGGALGWLAGAGALAIPGIGPFVAAGPIIASIAGAGIGSAVGGVTGGLIGLGIPEYEAKRYETSLKQGGMLISVHVDDTKWASKAKDILLSCGADDVATVGEKKMSDHKDDITSNPNMRLSADDDSLRTFTSPV